VRAARRKPPIRSLISYKWQAPVQDHAHDAPNESTIDDLLRAAKRDGIVREYSTGRGLIVWFEGAPGEKLRNIRDRVRTLLPSNWKSTPKGIEDEHVRRHT
jgi:hypothetical protein